MRRFLACALGALAMSAAADDSFLPADRATLSRDAVAALLARDEYPATSGYTQRVESIDFTSFGQEFTQVVVILTPDKPRLHRGRKLVVVGGEPGSEYAGDFLATPEGKEGPGVWLARRGVTFVALTRVGRWNFLAPDGSGSWEGVPVESRMPIFNRGQKAHWTSADYEVKASGLQGATGGDSAVYRLPKPGTQLYREMLAATPITYLTGYRLAVEHAVPPAERRDAFVLYWGMSTGGAFLYPLAKWLPPDGYLGWATSSTGLAYAYRRAKGGDRQPRHERHQRRGDSAAHGGRASRGDGAVRAQVPRRARRGATALSLHAGPDQGRGHALARLHRLRLFRLPIAPRRARPARSSRAGTPAGRSRSARLRSRRRTGAVCAR